MKFILFNKNTTKFEEHLKDLNIDFESNIDNLKKIIKNYDGLIGFGVDKTIDLSHLKWIQSLGAGVDWATTNLTVHKDIIITRITESLEVKLFEYTLSKILFYYQNIERHLINQQQNNWDPKFATSIVGKTALIIGAGKIGKYIGLKLKSLGMIVDAVNSSGSSIEGFRNTTTFNNINYSHKYDVVVNVLPSTSKTINIFNKQFFNKINCDIFINVGRGNAVVISELVKKLEKDKIKAGFLDVFPEEPLPSSSPYWQVKNLYLTPHVAGLANFETVIKTIKDNYNTIKENKIPKEIVDHKKGY